MIIALLFFLSINNERKRCIRLILATASLQTVTQTPITSACWKTRSFVVGRSRNVIVFAVAFCVLRRVLGFCSTYSPQYTLVVQLQCPFAFRNNSKISSSDAPTFLMAPMSHSSLLFDERASLPMSRQSIHSIDNSVQQSRTNSLYVTEEGYRYNGGQEFPLWLDWPGAVRRWELASWQQCSVRVGCRFLRGLCDKVMSNHGRISEIGLGFSRSDWFSDSVNKSRKLNHYYGRYVRYTSFKYKKNRFGLGLTYEIRRPHNTSRQDAPSVWDPTTSSEVDG